MNSKKERNTNIGSYIWIIHAVLVFGIGYALILQMMSIFFPSSLLNWLEHTNPLLENYVNHDFRLGEKYKNQLIEIGKKERILLISHVAYITRTLSTTIILMLVVLLPFTIPRFFKIFNGKKSEELLILEKNKKLFNFFYNKRIGSFVCTIFLFLMSRFAPLPDSVYNEMSIHYSRSNFLFIFMIGMPISAIFTIFYLQRFIYLILYKNRKEHGK